MSCLMQEETAYTEQSENKYTGSHLSPPASTTWIPLSVLSANKNSKHRGLEYEAPVAEAQSSLTQAK